MASSSVLDTLRQSPKFNEQLSALSDAELYALLYDWETAARPNQKIPAGDWATWLILAGRGYGKTRVGAETVRQWIKQGFNRVNFIAPTADDLRDVMVEGESGILAVCPQDERPLYRVSKRRLEWPNGALSLLSTKYNRDVKDVLDASYKIGIAKNRDYGTVNILKYGVVGLIVRLNDKISRAVNLLKEGNTALVADEKVEDTIMDMVNYATYGIMLCNNVWL